MRVASIHILLIFFFTNCNGQKTFGVDQLKLVKEIAMPDVKGRIDHMAFNVQDQILYVAALGNNSVEVIDVKSGAVKHSIKNIDEPQGVAYLPGQNEIVVASGGNGDCIFYNASTFEKIAAVHLSSDADNIRYDSAEKKCYVGYGNGALALIDPGTHQLISEVKLSAHPESFQLDKKNQLLFVNLPDDHSIDVIDLKSFTLKQTWKTNGLSANFPMALDAAANLVIVCFRHPATLVAYDVRSGKEISRTDMVGDADDVFYYAEKKLAIASGGDGYLNIFQKDQDNRFRQVANIATRNGARTSLFVPSLQYLFLAERVGGGKPASLMVYYIND
jgi:YVTN family beta-propeller protein